MVAKAIPFQNETNRVVYLFWTSDKNAQQTNKSHVNMNAGADGAGFGYGRERERKDVHTGELSICPGDTSTLEMPTSTIFVTISSESGSYTKMPPCIFIDRPFSVQNCTGYIIREHKFASLGIGLPPPMQGYGGNAVHSGMHPQIMGGQQQVQPVPTMSPAGSGIVAAPPMPGYGGNAVPREMHPQIMGGQQQVQMLFAGQDHGIGGHQQVGWMHPHQVRMQKGDCSICGDPVFVDQGRGKTMDGSYVHAKCGLTHISPDFQYIPGDSTDREQREQVGWMHPHQVRMQKGDCGICGFPVFVDQGRGKTRDGSYVHAECGLTHISPNFQYIPGDSTVIDQQE
jgi:hypothetical protein